MQQPGPVQPLVPQHTAFCIGCKVQLSYPAGSPVIQCPRCNQTQNPGNSHQTPCLNCGTILAHPSNSVFIECPLCQLQMVTSAKERLLQNTQGKQKKRKDPSAPKASSNAYMIFCKERRSKLKEEHPELPFGKLGAKLGEIWRNMSAEQKKPYEDRAAADRERYRKQMQDYQCSTPASNPDTFGIEPDLKRIKRQPHFFPGSDLNPPEEPIPSPMHSTRHSALALYDGEGGPPLGEATFLHGPGLSGGGSAPPVPAPGEPRPPEHHLTPKSKSHRVPPLTMPPSGPLIESPTHADLLRKLANSAPSPSMQTAQRFATQVPVSQIISEQTMAVVARSHPDIPSPAHGAHNRGGDPNMMPMPQSAVAVATAQFDSDDIMSSSADSASSPDVDHLSFAALHTGGSGVEAAVPLRASQHLSIPPPSGSGSVRILPASIPSHHGVPNNEAVPMNAQLPPHHQQQLQHHHHQQHQQQEGNYLGIPTVVTVTPAAIPHRAAASMGPLSSSPAPSGQFPVPSPSPFGTLRPPQQDSQLFRSPSVTTNSNASSTCVSVSPSLTRQSSMGMGRIGNALGGMSESALDHGLTRDLSFGFGLPTLPSHPSLVHTISDGIGAMPTHDLLPRDSSTFSLGLPPSSLPTSRSSSQPDVSLFRDCGTVSVTPGLFNSNSDGSGLQFNFSPLPFANSWQDFSNHSDSLSASPLTITNALHPPGPDGHMTRLSSSPNIVSPIVSRALMHPIGAVASQPSSDSSASVPMQSDPAPSPSDRRDTQNRLGSSFSSTSGSESF